MENWKTIKDFENYEISDRGRVKNKITGKILKGWKNSTNYVHVELNKKQLKVHRLVALNFLDNPDNKPLVDHIDGDLQNNRLENLRFATSTENNRNTKPRKNKSVKFKGVSYHKQHKKYNAQIKFQGKNNHLGYYNTPEEAYEEYCKKARELFGEFARFD
jgi:hypothetical protein